MADNQTNPTVQPKAKVTKLRSPAYPGINLETAIKRADGLWKKERRNAVPYSVAVSHWGFGPKSSGGLVAVAAMKSFGLLQDVERGPAGRVVKLTDLAYQLLLDERPDSQDRAASVKRAALMPKIHAAIWKKYGTTSGVSDANLKHDLIFSMKFNENTVDEFIKEYKDTISYAKLVDSDNISAGVEDKDDGTEGDDIEDAMIEETRTKTLSPAPPPLVRDPKSLLSQALVVSIPRNFRVDINVRGDELKREDLDKIKSQFNRWIEGLEEAFE